MIIGSLRPNDDNTEAIGSLDVEKMESMKPTEQQTQLRLSECRSQAFLQSAPRSLWEPSC